jgi:hypothetical protein
MPRQASRDDKDGGSERKAILRCLWRDGESVTGSKRRYFIDIDVDADLIWLAD